MPADEKAKSFDLSYKGSVTPKGAKFLKSEPIKMDFEASIELDGSDQANVKAIEKEFQSEVSNRIDKQLGSLEKWLREKDALIVELEKDYETLQKGGLALAMKDPKSWGKTVEDMKKAIDNIDDLKDAYATIVSDWAKNCSEQQGIIAMQVAVKKARVAAYNEKRTKIQVATAAKGILIVAGIAIGITALVLSAGTLTPVIIGLTAAGIGIAGLGNLTAVGKSIYNIVDMEKRIVKNVQQDVEAVQAAFGQLGEKKTSIAKHVTELSNLIKKRDDEIEGMYSQIKKKSVELASYNTEINKLKSTEVLKGADLDKKSKDAAKLESQVDGLTKKIDAVQAKNKNAKDLLKTLAELNVDLDKISKQANSTIVESLKDHVKDADSALDLVSDVADLASSAVGL